MHWYKSAVILGTMFVWRGSAFIFGKSVFYGQEVHLYWEQCIYIETNSLVVAESAFKLGNGPIRMESYLYLERWIYLGINYTFKQK